MAGENENAFETDTAGNQPDGTQTTDQDTKPEGSEDKPAGVPIEDQVKAFTDGAAEAAAEEDKSQLNGGKPVGDGSDGGKDEEEGEGKGEEATEDQPKPAEGEAKTEEEKAADAEAAKKAEDDAEINKEADALELKGKSRERFHELATSAKDATRKLEQQQNELTSAREMVEANKEVMDTLIDSGVTGPQLGGMLTVAKLMNSDDPRDREAAFDGLLDELKTMARDLGKEIPGFADPLDAHPDLAKAVEEGDVTREFALQSARERSDRARRDQTDQQRQEQTQRQNAEQQAMTDLSGLYNELGQQDPQYARKIELLTPAIEEIVANRPPDQWVNAIRNAYKRMPALPASAPAPAASPAPVAHNPMRPSVQSSSQMRKEFDPSTSDAFLAGVDEASPQG